MATIREKIILRMKELNIKQVDLCEKLGIRNQNLSTYLKGARSIPFEHLEMVCEAIGLTVGRADRARRRD